MIATGDGTKQRRTLGALGIVAALVLLVASMVMNYRFGYSLGKSPEDGLIYGAISAAADAFKALCPFFFFAAWRDRQWAGAIASAVVWLVVVLYASAGAAGHAGSNRLATAGERTLAVDQYKDLRAAKTRYEEQLKWLPAHRGADAVKADLEGIKGQLLWTQSTECTEARGKQREFCQGYHKLAAELGNATKADEYVKKIEAIDAKLENTKGGALVTDADPQATIISRTLVFIGVNIALADTQTWLAIAVALVLEIGSTFGLYISVLYFGGTSHSNIIDADYREVDASQERAAEPALPALIKPDLIAGPESQASVDHSVEPVHASEHASEPVGRKHLPGSEDSLRAIGFPLFGPAGRTRDKLDPKDTAARFLVWLQAFDCVREKLSSEELDALYAEFCKADNRHPANVDRVKTALERLRAVDKQRPKGPKGEAARPVRWDIRPGKYPKPDQQQEGGNVFALGRRPLAVAPEMAQPIIEFSEHRRAA